MNQKFGINYYPGSVGDAFIAHAFPDVIFKFDSNFGIVELLNVFFLKNPFWEQDITNDKVNEILKKYNIISMHRFNKFDFTPNQNIKIISIDPTGLEQNIADRNLSTLSNFPKYGEYRKNFMSDKNLKTRSLYFSAIIKKWTQEQILSTDIVLSLDQLVQNQNDYFLQWKKENNLILNDLSDEFYFHLKKSLNLD